MFGLPSVEWQELPQRAIPPHLNQIRPNYGDYFVRPQIVPEYHRETLETSLSQALGNGG